MNENQVLDNLREMFIDSIVDFAWKYWIVHIFWEHNM